MAHAAARPFPGESKGTTEVPLGKCAVRHKSTAAFSTSNNTTAEARFDHD